MAAWQRVRQPYLLSRCVRNRSLQPLPSAIHDTSPVLLSQARQPRRKMLLSLRRVSIQWHTSTELSIHVSMEYVACAETVLATLRRRNRLTYSSRPVRNDGNNSFDLVSRLKFTLAKLKKKKRCLPWDQLPNLHSPLQQQAAACCNTVQRRPQRRGDHFFKENQLAAEKSNSVYTPNRGQPR